ncbi:hypothetical protein [Microvirga sp. KLBC 81]|nr:hypothetical protein [Microvirga sp. KLBC 81]
MANWISLNDAKRQLLDVAWHLEAMAELEERGAHKTTPMQNPQPEQ